MYNHETFYIHYLKYFLYFSAICAVKRPMTKKKQTHSISDYTLSERLKYLRLGRKLTQKDLAENSGVSQSTIAQIETGRKDPSITTLRKLSDALDMDIALFFATDDVHVFDMKRLKKKYKSVDDLNPTLYTAIGKIIRYAKDINYF